MTQKRRDVFWADAQFCADLARQMQRRSGCECEPFAVQLVAGDLFVLNEGCAIIEELNDWFFQSLSVLGYDIGDAQDSGFFSSSVNRQVH